MVITAVEKQKHNANRYSVFIDGEFKFGMDGEDIILHKIRLGAEITSARLVYLMDRVIFVKAQEKALRFLHYRARTNREMERKLRQSGFGEETIQKTLDWLTGYGYLNDQNFAESYLRSDSQGKSKGLYRIKQELKQKGIAESVINQVLSQDPPDQEEAAAAALHSRIRKKTVLDQKEKKRCMDFLARRGFSYGVIQIVLAREFGV